MPTKDDEEERLRSARSLFRATPGGAEVGTFDSVAR